MRITSFQRYITLTRAAKKWIIIEQLMSYVNNNENKTRVAAMLYLCKQLKTSLKEKMS